MAIRYFYIDDDDEKIIQETAKGLSVHTDQLLVTPHEHLVWDKQVDFLVKNQKNFDGLLVDWNLSNKNSAGDHANFDVEALAQQIRRLVIEKGKLKHDFPIVLCSANYKFRDIYHRELTSHDLFDLVYEKDDFDNKQELVIARLIDLSMGYQAIGKTESPKRLLGVKSDEESDYRIINMLKIYIDKKEPIHEIARFILRKVVEPSGVLIDAYLLAAKLGVDIIDNENNQEWEKLLTKLESIKYKGVFAQGWKRWWSQKLYDWWEINFGESLGSLEAKERVEILNKKFKLKLVPASPTIKSTDSLFWVKCKQSNRPISLRDALISSSIDDNPEWVDDEYYSIDAALELNPLKIHPLERNKLKSLKEQFTRARKK
jgi:hypothetical protein